MSRILTAQCRRRRREVGDISDGRRVRRCAACTTGSGMGGSTEVSERERVPRVGMSAAAAAARRRDSVAADGARCVSSASGCWGAAVPVESVAAAPLANGLAVALGGPSPG
eukprot:6199352-Pleurochrysis_carterae.AAC.2